MPTKSQPLDRLAATPAWRLEGLADDGRGMRQIPLVRFPFRIGRRNDLELCLNSTAVSKLHAELFERQGLWVGDLSSTNGTFVNGQRIFEPRQLVGGDLLHFANIEFRIQAITVRTQTSTMQIDALAALQAVCSFERLFDGENAVPYYQPIQRLADGTVCGYEVLARSGLDGLEMPNEMFRAAAQLQREAELSRLFREVGVRVGTGLPRLYLNTHPVETNDPDLITSLRRLRESAPDRPLTLEIHESAVTHPASMRSLRVVLDSLQIGLAYDDFGSGQDRLLDLAEVPPDVLKFDIRLIRDLDRAPAGRQQTVAAMVRLSKELGTAPLAEGIERKEELEVCKQLGFELGLGYYLGRPAPIETWRTP